MQKKYDKKIVSTLAFSLCLVSLLFVISFVFNFFGGFELKPPETYDMILGENSSIVFNDYGSQSVGFVFSGKSLPGDTIQQNVQIKLPKLNLEGYALRAKAFVGRSDANSNADFLGFDSWEKQSDGYYYYNNNIEKMQEVGLCSEVVLPLNMPLKSNIKYVLIFTAELIKV